MLLPRAGPWIHGDAPGHLRGWAEPRQTPRRPWLPERPEGNAQGRPECLQQRLATVGILPPRFRRVRAWRKKGMRLRAAKTFASPPPREVPQPPPHDVEHGLLAHLEPFALRHPCCAS